MGITIAYYLLNDEITSKIIEEKNQKKFFFLDDYIEDNNFEHTYYNCWLKSWNPFYYLLFLMTENKIFKKFYSSDSDYELTLNIFNHKEIEELYKSLKKISIDDIENAILNPKFKEEIKNQNGYHMERIDNANLIIGEFFELLKSIFDAKWSNRQIIQIFYP